jgi:hypothetical protein
MTFRVSPEIFGAFTGLRVGMAVARGIDNREVCPEIRISIEEIQNQMNDTLQVRSTHSSS